MLLSSVLGAGALASSAGARAPARPLACRSRTVNASAKSRTQSHWEGWLHTLPKHRLMLHLATATEQQHPVPDDLDEGAEVEEYEEGEEWDYEEDGEFVEDLGEQDEEEEEQEEEEGEAAASSPDQAEQYVDVGLITTCHGVRGEVKVQPLTDSPKMRFGRKGAKVWMQAPIRRGLMGSANGQQQALQQMTVETARTVSFKGDQQAWIIKFTGINSREQAEQLQKHRLLVAASEREGLRDPDEFYVQDLVGLSVHLRQGGQLVGRVADVMSGMGSHDSLKVELAQSEEDLQQQRLRICYIPFVKDICPWVDLKQKRLELTPPDGLLDIYSVVSLRKRARGRTGPVRGRPAAGAAPQAQGQE